MEKKITHTAQTRGQYHYNEKLVCFMTGMSDVELFDLIADSGVAWVMEVLAPDDDEVASATQALPRNDVPEAEASDFWAMPGVSLWWFNQWRLEDDYHILPALYKMTFSSNEERAAVYKQMHAAAVAEVTAHHDIMLKGLLSALENSARFLGRAV
ncbi:hypothetical protein EBZ39_03610 [bacterium]|nr:hypothetical protein [bacterium]